MYYYYNEATEEATWDRPVYRPPPMGPPMVLPPPPPVPPMVLAPGSAETPDVGVDEVVEPTSLHCGFFCESGCPAVCGDGVLVGSEGCDDGNTIDGDGCSATCTVEANFQCIDSELEEPWEAIWERDQRKYFYWNAATGESSWKQPVRQTFQGTLKTPTPPMVPPPSAKAPDQPQYRPEEEEEESSDELSEVVEPLPLDCGLSCSGLCPAVCGDGMRVDVPDHVAGDSEGCDDGNTIDGDGCSSTCTVEDNFQCIEMPWQATWDAEFGVYYYWNLETAESIWEKPARQTFGREGNK